MRALYRDRGTCRSHNSDLHQEIPAVAMTSPSAPGGGTQVHQLAPVTSTMKLLRRASLRAFIGGSRPLWAAIWGGNRANTVHKLHAAVEGREQIMRGMIRSTSMKAD